MGKRAETLFQTQDREHRGYIIAVWPHREVPGSRVQIQLACIEHPDHIHNEQRQPPEVHAARLHTGTEDKPWHNVWVDSCVDDLRKARIGVPQDYWPLSNPPKRHKR